MKTLLAGMAFLAIYLILYTVVYARLLGAAFPAAEWTEKWINRIFALFSVIGAHIREHLKKRDERNNDLFLQAYTEKKVLDRQVLDGLAFQIDYPYYARQFLKEIKIGEKAKAHLWWIVIKGYAALWGMRLASLMAVAWSLNWQFPSLRGSLAFSVAVIALYLWLPNLSCRDLRDKLTGRRIPKWR